MKKLTVILLMLAIFASSASATILPADGVNEGFKAFTGMDCTSAVVLCESLSILNARGDQGGKKVDTLYYGQKVPVLESWDGYAKISYYDATRTGWVRNDYLLMDPAWYICDDDMQVYAYPDTMSPRVALLNEGTKLPILTEWADGKSINGWVCVSLRGAAGWIRKTPADTASDTWFRPEMLADITYAQLTCGGETVGCNAVNILEELSVLLTNVRDQGGAMAGCPFAATLQLTLQDGQTVELQLATDSCCVYRVNNRDYSYARHLWSDEEGSPENSVLFSLFGMDASVTWAGQ